MSKLLRAPVLALRAWATVRDRWCT